MFISEPCLIYTIVAACILAWCVVFVHLFRRAARWMGYDASDDGGVLFGAFWMAVVGATFFPATILILIAMRGLDKKDK